MTTRATRIQHSFIRSFVPSRHIHPPLTSSSSSSSMSSSSSIGVRRHRRCPRCDARVANARAAVCAECGCAVDEDARLGTEARRSLAEYPSSSSYDDDDDDGMIIPTHDDRYDYDYASSSDDGTKASSSSSSDTDDSARRAKKNRIERERELERSSPEALKLLYLMYTYTSDDDDGVVWGDPTSSSTTTSKKSRRASPCWFRQLPILVLIYEGIVRGVFDYDYAPQAVSVYGGARIYLNISEEGRDDLDDLRELDMLKALKVTSEQYNHATLLKITTKGVEFVKRVMANNVLTAGMRKAVDSLIFEAGSLIQVRYDSAEKKFYLAVPDMNFSIASTITDIEEVPYVSSPYIVPCMLANVAFTPDVAAGHRRAQRILASRNTGGRGIRDSHLDQSLALDDVKLFVTEWVPMGSNEMVSFCTKLGTGERVPGGMFSERALDADEFDMVVAIGAEHKTKLVVLDLDETSYVNVEAELLQTATQKTTQATQVENFGVNFSETGVITYGLYVNGIADRVQKNISLDLLARLLSDVYEDTSYLVSNLFSAYQRSMLDMAYKGEADNREKFVCIMADRITPKLRAEEYMDDENYENELKQVIGATFNAHDLSGEEIIVFGSQGVIICGPNSSRHDRMLSMYCALQARSSFIKSVFSSCFALADELKRTRALVDDYQSDPTNVIRIRERLSSHTSAVTVLYEIQQFILESLESIDPSLEAMMPSSSIKQGALYDSAAKKLYDLLDLEGTLKRSRRRVIDLQKVVSACFNDLEALRDMSQVIGSTRKLQINQMIEGTTKNLEDAFRAQARNSTTLEVTQVILSGSLAFDILDRLTGQYLSYTEIRWANESIQPYLVNEPMVWFTLNVIMWTILGGGIIYLMRHLAYMNLSVETKKLLLNKPIHVKRWRRFVASRNMESIACKEEKAERVTKYGWIEPVNVIKWRGSSPKIEVTCDERYGYILSSVILINKRTCKLTADECWRIFWHDNFEVKNIYDPTRNVFNAETGKRVETSAQASDDEDEDAAAPAFGASMWQKSGLSSSFSRKSKHDIDDDGSDSDEYIGRDFTYEGFVAERNDAASRL
jgi:ribosomal protein L37E